MHMLHGGRNDADLSTRRTRDHRAAIEDPVAARRPVTVSRLMAAGLSVFALRTLLPGWAAIIDDVPRERCRAG